MERIFEVYTQGNETPKSVFTETELRRRLAVLKNEWRQQIGYQPGVLGKDIQDAEIDILLHGEPKEKDEWVDFGQSLDDGLHHWYAGNGIGYLVETFRKMPRGK